MTATHYSRTTGELLTIAPELHAAWVASGNPKADEYRPLPPVPDHDPTTHTARWGAGKWIVEPLPPPPVPESVHPHHIRRALTAAGLRAQVEALIGSLPEGHPMRDDWEYAPMIRRDSVGIEAVRMQLGLTRAQVDDVFRAAAAVRT